MGETSVVRQRKEYSSLPVTPSHLEYAQEGIAMDVISSLLIVTTIGSHLNDLNCKQTGRKQALKGACIKKYEVRQIHQSHLLPYSLDRHMGGDPAKCNLITKPTAK